MANPNPDADSTSTETASAESGPTGQATVEIGSTGTITDNSKGTVFVTQHTTRQEPLFGIFPNELDTVGNLEWNQALWMSIASAAFSVVLACVWGMIQANEAEQKFSILSLGFPGLCLGIGIFASLTCRYYRDGKATLIEKIKEQSSLHGENNREEETE